MTSETAAPCSYRFYMTGSVQDFCDVRARYRGETLWYQFRDVDVITVEDEAFLVFTVNFEFHSDCIEFYLSHSDKLKLQKVEGVSAEA